MDGSMPAALDEAAIVADLASDLTYDQIAAKYRTSRWKVWTVACKWRARKNEALRSERAELRRKHQREFYKELINSTVTGDVLDVLQGIPSKSVALVVTSPPYGVARRYGDDPSLDTHRHFFWLGWLTQVLSECERILIPGGTLFLQVGSTRDQHGRIYPIDLCVAETLKSMGLTFQSRVVWTIAHGLTPKKRLSERYETALVYSKGEQRCFNPTPARTGTKEPDKRAFKGPRKGELTSHWAGSHPSNVWAIRPVGANHREKTGHPAQFPEELVRRAVLLYSMPGDLIADPFSGSGTTAAVARKTHRSFIGADLFYEDMRAKRLAKVDPDLVSILPGVTDQSIAVWQAEAKRVAVPAEGQKAIPQLGLSLDAAA